MSTELRHNATFVGQIASVRGGLVTVRLRETPTTLIMVGGHAYRVGQIGAFMRIPLGYTQLYGVCTQVGADSAPGSDSDFDELILEQDSDERLAGFRWLTLALFGESVGGSFDRGVGQYPTVGDEAHLVTPPDLDVIYGQRSKARAGLTVGRIADSDGLPATLDISAVVSRHSCVIGSTGSGKSNLVAVLLEGLTSAELPSSRKLVFDPHDEYGTALGDQAQVLRTGPETRDFSERLRVPYWALPFDHLIELTMGTLQPQTLETIRDTVREMKLEGAALLSDPPPPSAITADSPVPFSIRKLWFELEDIERSTFEVSNGQTAEKRYPPDQPGSPEDLIPPTYPAASAYNQPPYFNRQRRGIGRQLDLMRSRLLDARYRFMFDPTDPLHPNLLGETEADLAELIRSWVGGDKRVTVVDVSGIPAEVLGTVVGTMMQLVYDALFWGMELAVGGRKRPLLVVVDEAHRFLPGAGGGLASTVFNKIAKEGRKYGVGLMVVTQRPSDVDPGILSQCGTMIALRVSNRADQAAVGASVPDDLGGLTDLVPSLRTGEALVLGEAMHVPSRVRVRLASSKPAGSDPALPGAWEQPRSAEDKLYGEAVRRWRAQTTTA